MGSARGQAGVALRLRALSCATGVLLGAACESVRPADPALVALLENASSPADQADLVEAERQLQQGYIDQALASCRRLLPRNPGCSRLAILARRTVALADSDEQRQLLEEEFRTLFAELMPRESTPQVGASLAFAIALFARDDTEQAEWLEKALVAEGNHYFALCKHGERLWRNGELERAKEVLTKTIVLRKSLAEGWLLLARVAEDRGLYRTADKHYQTYLGLRPLDRHARLNYARLLVHLLHDGKRAEPILDKLYRSDPTNLEVGLHRGLAYHLQSKWTEAETTYRELLRRYPREPRIVLSLANLYFGGTRDLAKALQAYRFVLRLPMSADPLVILHQLLFVPSRIQDIEKLLAEQGVEIPDPPQSGEDLFR